MFTDADALMSKGKFEDAAAKFEGLDREHPYSPEARRAMVMAAYAYYKAGKSPEAIASWVPYTIFGFEVMVLIGGLSTVFGLFALVRIPRLVTTVGYDPRFSQGNYGIFAEGTQDQMRGIEATMRRHGAVEVRGER